MHFFKNAFLYYVFIILQGYIIQKKDKKPNPKPGEDEELLL